MGVANPALSVVKDVVFYRIRSSTPGYQYANESVEQMMVAMGTVSLQVSQDRVHTPDCALTPAERLEDSAQFVVNYYVIPYSVENNAPHALNGNLKHSLKAVVERGFYLITTKTASAEGCAKCKST